MIYAIKDVQDSLSGAIGIYFAEYALLLDAHNRYDRVKRLSK